MVEVNNFQIGCIGIRKKEKFWDIYNVILGEKKFGKKGYMSIALDLVVNYAKKIFELPIELSVLKKNPAIKWYEKNGFSVIGEYENYYKMRKL